MTLPVYKKEPSAPAKACVIWMHGLGSNAADMMGLAEQLPLKDCAIRHVFIDSPTRPVTLNGGMIMPAWYDILGMELVDREDQKGIEASAALIRPLIDEQLANGLKLEQIYLAGFSQGGAMALYTALTTEGRLGGVIALSAYLPLAQSIQPTLDKATPFFMGSGRFDSVVQPEWTFNSKERLVAVGYSAMAFNLYAMDHSVCFEEINDLCQWLTDHVQGVM